MRFPLAYSITLSIIMSGCSPTSEPTSDATEALQFVGSKACSECHTDASAAWQGSHHELAIQHATPTSVLGDFDNAEFDYYGETSRFTTHGDEFAVETVGADGKQQSFPVAFTFGVYPLQQYLLEFPGGRMQALPIAWDSRKTEDGGQRWYHLYPDEHIAANDELHWTGRYQNWNYMCAECHATNLDMGYDVATDTFDTTYSELSVGCEACHGPASTHIQQASDDAFDAQFGLSVNLNNDSVWTMNPETGIAERSVPATAAQQQPETCGRCHSRRGLVATEYEYGKPLADTHMVALLDEHLYFADGQIDDEVYVYGSFVQSRMHQAGVVCSDCHDPHTLKLRTGPEPSLVCAQCHLPTTFDTVEHTRHESVSASCLDCHMPARTYMGVDDRRDHSFRIPRPDLSVRTGAPNACTSCHSDKDSAWATSELLKSDPKNRPHYGAAIHAGRADGGNELLINASMNQDFPAIARATALSLLEAPIGANGAAAIRDALQNSDPLLRMGALRALRNASPEIRSQIGAATLGDPVRSVRLEAVLAFADLRDLLPAEQSRAFGRAAEEYRETHQALGHAADALGLLGSFEFATGDDLQALLQFERAVARAPNRAVLRHSLGLAMVRTGRHQEALAEFRQAQELEPGIARFAYVYGVALNSLGESDAAIEVLQTARARFPDDFAIAWAVATMLRDNGDREGARKVAADLAARFPGNGNIAALQDSLGED